MAETARQYMRKVLVASGMSESDADATIQKAHAANATLVEDTLYNSNELRSMETRYTTAKAEADRVKAEADAYYNTWAPKYNALATEVETLRGTKPNGNGNGNGNEGNSPVYITLQDMQRQLAERDERYVALTKGVHKVGQRHFKKYNEELDIDALEKFMSEKNIPNVEQAYELFVTPKAEKLREEEMEKRIQKAKEEAVREYASKHQLPVDTTPRESSPLFSGIHNANGNGSVSDLDAKLLESWNSVGQSA